MFLASDSAMLKTQRLIRTALLLLCACTLAFGAHATALDSEGMPVFKKAATLHAPLSEEAVAASVAHHTRGTRLAALADEELADKELGDVDGQAGSLFVSDKIRPNELTGGSTANFTDFTYYRMGMDVKLDMNLNIARLQLGCGGVNDMLTGPGCDLDVEYMGFMGLNATNDRPSSAGPDSVFTMTRPYVELAVKNDGTATREVVGIKIGAQKINGAIRMGRDYTGFGGFGQEAALTNMENGGTCVPTATTGAGMVACHSGANSLSGFLAGVELSAGFQANANVCFFLCINLDMDGCFGRINFAECTTGSMPFFIDAGGTRLDQLHVAAAPLTLTVLGIDIDGYGQLKLSTRPIHYLLTPNSSDFFLSFQRERISWPRYEKAPPANNVAFDSCNPAYGQIPTNGRCGSAYAEPANTGWWLSAANIKMLNLLPDSRIYLPGNLDLAALLSALGPSSNILIDNPKLDFAAVRNCYGSQIFC